MHPDSRLKKIRIGGLLILGYLLIATYSIARPAVESIFLEAQSSKGLPLAWLMVAIGVMIAVTVYNRFVAHLDLLKLFGFTSLVSAALLVVLLVGKNANIPGIDYALYVWKDVYIIVLVEIYYSYANSVFPIRTARWIYGLFGAAGALGGISGSLITGFLAQNLGTVTVLMFVPPLLAAISLGCMPFAKMAGIGNPLEKKHATGSISESVRVIRKSSYLFLILILVALVQIAITLIDFEYNVIVERTFPTLDARTAIIGKIYGLVHIVTMALHLLTGPILRLAGVPIVLMMVPLILGSGLAAFAAIPRFLSMALVKVTSKCFDYTIFRSAKEILYIPLSYAEKTEGKSIIDMMVYRISKGGASILLMGIVALNANRTVTWITFGLIALWLGVTIVITRRFRKKVSREEEMAPNKEFSCSQVLRSRTQERENVRTY